MLLRDSFRNFGRALLPVDIGFPEELTLVLLADKSAAEVCFNFRTLTLHMEDYKLERQNTDHIAVLRPEKRTPT